MKSTIRIPARALLAGVMLFLAQAAGQTKHKVTPETLAIDATVMDAAGKGIPGLELDDFDVQFGGKPVHLTKADSAGAPGGGSKDPQLVIWPRAQGLGDDRRAVTVFVVDDLALSGPARKGVREAIGHFIDEKLEAGDEAAIVRTRGGSGNRQELTSDKALLHQALGEMAEEGSSAAQASLSYNDAIGGLAIGILRPVLDGLRQVSGRKTVVLFSENMQLFGSPAVDVKSLAARANRASVVFYSVDPRGLVHASLSGLTLDQIPLSGGLGGLARESGGVFFDNTNDAAKVLERIAQLREGYYRIEFSAPLDADSGHALFGGVVLKVKRPDARVQTRAEFARPADAASVEFPETPFGYELPAPPFSSGEISLRVTPLMAYNTKSAIDVLLRVDAQGITFTTDSKGIDTATVEVGATAVRGNGQVADRAIRSYTLRFPHARMQSLRDSLTASVRLSMPSPGPVEVHAEVRDATSGRVGSGREFLDFPDLASGRLAISGIFLDGVPGSGGTEAETGENAAVRVFRPGRKITFSYAIFNAKMNAEKQPQVDFQVRVYREGEVIMSTGLATANLGAPSEPGRWGRSGQLELKPSARPGNFRLEITVIDRTSTEKPPPAVVRSIDFEVR